MKNVRIDSLFDNIIKNCRRKASMLESLKSGDGAIRLCFIPQNSVCAKMLPMAAGLWDRYEIVARLSEGGNYVINRDSRDGEPVDTYAFSALKVAACLKAYELNSETRRSGDKLGDGYDEAHGFGPYKGALLYELFVDHRICALLIVVVSGGKQEEDELAAMEAESAIHEWCNKTNAICSAAVSLG